MLSSLIRMPVYGLQVRCGRSSRHTLIHVLLYCRCTIFSFFHISLLLVIHPVKSRQPPTPTTIILYFSSASQPLEHATKTTPDCPYYMARTRTDMLPFSQPSSTSRTASPKPGPPAKRVRAQFALSQTQRRQQSAIASYPSSPRPRLRSELNSLQLYKRFSTTISQSSGPISSPLPSPF